MSPPPPPDYEHVFSVRIVSLDYYMAPPIPDLDFCYSSFQGRNVEEVPVIRIYGSTPAGQKTCLHIHRALPYLYISCSDVLLKNPEEGHAYIHVLSRAIEKALKYRSTSASKGQHVHGCSLVRAKKFYGYHVSEELFIKIYLYYPRDIARLAGLLLDGAILNKSFQPFESHIPYLLQFLVDYNLYGMGHIHISNFKFRPPLPNVFIPKAALFKKPATQEGSSNDSLGGVSIWLACNVPISLIWSFSNAGNDSLGDNTMHLLRRQSVCGLEVDSSVDDILNEKYKIYTSLSQTRSDVKLVQSLIPIWEEEYERSGLQEAMQSPDSSKPCPEIVLRSFLHGLEYENALSGICIEAENSLPSKVDVVELNEKLDQCIKSFANIEKPLGLINPLRPEGSSGEQKKNVNMSYALFSDVKEEAVPSVDVPEVRAQESISKKLLSSQKIGSESPKCGDTEALGLLSWFASSQVSEDLNTDDELVHEVILSPLFPRKSYEKALEMAHLDFESASQQECQDILDSVEDVLMSEGLKDQVSSGNRDDCLVTAPSVNMIPQVDGSSDDNFKTPEKGKFLEVNINRKDKFKLQQDGKLTRLRSKYRKGISLWGSLPLSFKQKDHPDLGAASLDSSCDDDMKNDSESSSFFVEGGDTGYNASDVRTSSSGDKEGKILSSCSTRDLMRKKRFFRAEQSESERHFIKELSDLQKHEIEDLSSKAFVHHVFEEGIHCNIPDESRHVESPFTHQDAVDQEGENFGTSCTNAICTCEISRCKGELSVQLRNLDSKFSDDCSIKKDLHEKRTSVSSLISIQKGNITLHDPYKCMTNEDSEIVSEWLPEVKIPSCKESYSALETYMLQSKTHRTGEWDMETTFSNPCNDACTCMYKQKTPVEFMEMTLSLRPPSKDQIDKISEEPPGTSGWFLQDKEFHDGSLTTHSCFDSEKHGMDDLPPFFVKEFEDKRSPNLLSNQESGILPQESALGIPTHFQNDGLLLYILTHASSPPTFDSVRQWLVQQNSVDHAADPFLRSSNNFEVAAEDFGGCISGKSRVLLHEVDHINLEGLTEDTHDSTSGSLEMSQINKQSPEDKSYTDRITCSEPQLPGICIKDEQNTTNWHEVSQISGPDEKSHLTPLSQIGFRDPASVGGGQQLTLMSIEVLTESRGYLLPDPQFDAINIIALAIQEDTDHTFEIYVLVCCNDEDPSGRIVYGIPGCKFILVSEERHLLEHFLEIISSFDPDVLMGWEIQNSSLGFLAERAAHLGISLLRNISRTPVYDTKVKVNSSLDTEKGVLGDMLPEPSISHAALEHAIIEDEWGRLHASGIHVGGRIVLNIWRLMRAEVKLNMYTVEAVAEEVLRRKVPFIHCRVLNHWFSSGPRRARFKCIEYIVERAKLNLQILNQLDMVNRTSELARVFGIDFFSVLSRGSQFRVESMLMRLARTQNYLALSPGNQQVASQPAMECLPLVMEPESGFYADPVVVLDFQSLYPSMIIAYNLCFCTCLGKVSSKAGVLGVSSYSPDPQLLMELKQQLLLTPNGVLYVPQKVRKGVLPRLLEEILSTRIMVKKALKKLMPSQKVLQRIFNARQLALKLIANVTYGYTAAGFSGRMPCAELADSIVLCGRRTLETAISYVNGHDKWKARVVYGDTDSMFVLLKGRTVNEAFRIGNEIASAITAMNPYPVTLKMEKVYHPCFLLTKKRYVGYSYESPDQQKPTFDAKGIETVRRDTCPAVAKTLEQSIRIIFEHQDISKVKAYLQRQWSRILSGKVSLQDFVFAKEVRLGTYSIRASSLPPAAIVATKAMRLDPRAEPQYGQRIPYVVIHGEPGARLVDMVIDPLDLLDINTPYRVNDLYYINKQIIPALQRVFGLIGGDLKQWFSEISRPVRPLLSKRHVFVSHPWSLRESNDNVLDTSRKAQLKRSTIDTYYISRHCTLCGELVQASSYLCDNCLEKSPLVITAIVGKTSSLEKEIQHLAAICGHCGGGDWIVESGVKCTSLTCPVFYERRKVQKELQAISSFSTEAGFYPCCMAEWF